MKKKLLSLFYLSFPLIIGFIVSLIIKDYIDYSTLLKPPLAPPKVLFPIAWTILYILIGVSIYLFDKLELSKEENDQGVILYYFDLFFNSTWTLLFFKLKLRVFSCFWLGALLLIALIRFFVMKKKAKISAYLLLPYIMWLMFALYLNIAIVLV